MKIYSAILMTDSLCTNAVVAVNDIIVSIPLVNENTMALNNIMLVTPMFVVKQMLLVTARLSSMYS